ncbi:sensor histidine kinase [Pedobacter puniceum]|uniref:histidine kinase n=1 Tax=Pedobacter puniceum TaxID=2666136 RepID=A0A7K0FN92_9SPHI|nr:ATP-binding protein [Pedobacter puniceum]MRX47454.1 PAS domain S-box protein [Pedobacter puniceum]
MNSPANQYHLDHANYILQNIPYGILIEDSKRCIHSANQELIKIFGMDAKPEDLVGLDCEVLAEQVKQAFKNQEYFVQTINKCLSEKVKSGPYEFELVNGKFVELNYIPYYVNDAFAGHSWCYSNVTIKKNHELEVKKQSDFFSDILDSLPADIAIFSPQHTYMFLNKTAIQDDEFRQWMIGKTDYDYCNKKNKPTNIADERNKNFKKVLTSRQDVYWEDEIIKADGDKKIILRIFHPYINKTNEIEFVVGYGIDITEIKKKDLQILETELKSKFLIDNFKKVVFTADYEGKFVDINPAWEKITGFSVKSCLGNLLTSYVKDASFKQTLIDFLADNEKTELNLSFQIKTQKQLKWVEAYFSKNLSIDNKVKSFWGTLSDVDEQNKEKDKLLQLITKEKELNELKSKFVNMVSHEVRTPLAGILSSVELLEIINQNIDASLKEKSAKHYSRIKDQILKIGELMNDVLILGKIESGKIELDVEEVDFVANLSKFSTNNINITDSNIIKLFVKGTPKKVKMDWKLMEHVFTNLLSNAIKYTKDNQKSPEILINFHSKDVEVTIKDYGIGIPKDDLKLLFQPFKRASNVGNINGTGLGLILVKYFVELHKGEVSVISEENVGSSFTVKLPY